MALKYSRIAIRPLLIILAHFSGWLLFFSIPFFLRFNFQHPPEQFKRIDKDSFLYLTLLTNTILVCAFYFNIAILCPIFSRQRKYGKFFIAQMATIVLFYYVIRFITYLFFPHDMPLPLGVQIFNYVNVVLVALCYSLVRENIKVARERKEKENEALRSELLFLRWQISPHFLFNVLNNMVSLARKKSDTLQDMLFNLSNLMRYMLYETDEQKIPLEQEVEYLKSYISLQKMRLGNAVAIDVTISVQASANIMIEPMLLIPFVENAFKHGTGAMPEPIIVVIMEYGDNVLKLTVKNRYLPLASDMKDNTKGIGLPNVKRRLNLLYPNKYSLDVNDDRTYYTSVLKINLG